jgi:hypothetical protein
MSENEETSWLLKAAQEADAYVRQVPPMLKAAQETDALVQPYLPFLRDVQKHVDDLRATIATVGPVLAAPELAQAMNVGLYELLSVSPQQRDVLMPVPVASASGIAPPPSVVVSNADPGTEVAVPLDAKAVFLAVLWVFTILLPLKIGLLPPEAQAIIRDYIATVGLTLTIHWRVADSRKHD